MAKTKTATQGAKLAPIEKMRTAAKYVSKVLKNLSSLIEPGVTLLDIDRYAGELMLRYKIKSYDKGYHPKWSKTPFPANLCTSVNNCIAHGVPTPYKLKEGDIINLDIGIKVDGVCGDSALTIPVGEISEKDQLLLKFANRACYEAIETIKAGAWVGDIGDRVMKYSNDMGYRVNWFLSGHGIGYKMHEAPNIPHFYDRGIDKSGKKLELKYKEFFTGILKEGQVVCVEPMLTWGNDREGYLYRDGWSRLTRDKANSAMFEHMVLCTKTSHEVLTDHFEEA